MNNKFYIDKLRGNWLKMSYFAHIVLLYETIDEENKVDFNILSEYWFSYPMIKRVRLELIKAGIIWKDWQKFYLITE